MTIRDSALLSVACPSGQLTAHCAARLRTRPSLACPFRAGEGKLYQPSTGNPNFAHRAAVGRNAFLR